MKRFLAAFVLLATSVYGESTIKPEDVAATVNGEVITVAQLDRMYNSLSPQMRNNYDRAGGRQAFLANYIERRLVVQEAVKQNLEKKTEVQEALAIARENVLFDKYVREVVAPSVVPEGDLRAWFESHKDEFQKPERIKARHIIVSPQATPGIMNETGSDASTEEAALAKITRIEAQLKSGDLTFQDAARAYSEDVSAPEGGDLGWFQRGQMVGEFEAAAFKLEKGQTSPIVKSQFGYHLIQLIDRQPGGTASYEEVRRDIQESVYAERATEILAEVARVTRDLRSQSRVNVNITE